MDVDAVNDLDAVKFSAVSSLLPPIGPSVPGLSSNSLYGQVYASGVPNYKRCRIPIPHSKLNIKVWRRMLVDYPDYAICDLLELGFPLDFQGTDLDYSSRRNHKGAMDHTPYVSTYLSREHDSLFLKYLTHYINKCAFSS